MSRLLIGVPTNEYARRADFYDYLNQLEKPPGTILMSPHGSSPAESRNLIIEQAQKHECDEILFIDDDMAFKANAYNQLHEHDKDIVSGLYYKRNYPHQPLVFVGWEGVAGKFISLTGNEPRLIKIDAAGFGFCLIKTKVFDKLEKPYIRLGELAKDGWCDDIGFFLRAGQAEIESYCDTECLVGHIASMILWPSKVDGKWMTSYDTFGTGAVATPQLEIKEEVLV